MTEADEEFDQTLARVTGQMGVGADDIEDMENMAHQLRANTVPYPPEARDAIESVGDEPIVVASADWQLLNDAAAEAARYRAVLLDIADHSGLRPDASLAEAMSRRARAALEES